MGAGDGGWDVLILGVENEPIEEKVVRAYCGDSVRVAGVTGEVVAVGGGDQCGAEGDRGGQDVGELHTAGRRSAERSATGCGRRPAQTSGHVSLLDCHSFGTVEV